jgi:hypothetical protein
MTSPEDQRVELTATPDMVIVGEAEFLAELRRRSDEFERGEAELISWSQLKIEAI